jgi:hypothetical protein
MFVDPLIAAAVRTLARVEPLRAAEAVSQVVTMLPRSGDPLLEDVLAQLCRKAASLAVNPPARLAALRGRLESSRPNSPMVRTLGAALDAASAPAVVR